MARLARDCQRTLPWKAEIKHNYISRFLGYFATRDEAEAAERAKRLELTGTPEALRGAAKIHGRRHVSS
jgi:hypothetical protein